MIAQVLLTLWLALVAVYAWVASRKAPLVALMVGAATAAGLYFVWCPAQSTWVAQRIGIGRGADLVLYVWVIVTLLAIFNLHLKLRSQHELMTVLARRLALAAAEQPADNPDPTTANLGRNALD
jgi:hypothetical protein